MNKRIKKAISITLYGFLFSAILFASGTSESAASAFVEGCRAYSQGDWTSAEFMLKKAVAYPENHNPDAYYMLISSEMYAGDHKSALDDCNIFLEKFPNSIYLPRIKYQKGRILYNLGEYENAILTLSDFCHQNTNDEMYSYALFYIGESLYACYKYDDARMIFERIVQDYSNSPKADAAQYRIESILQHTREEKLLYLLKQTGEEYLSAKEEYEKQLRLANAENSSRRRQLAATQAAASTAPSQTENYTTPAEDSYYTQDYGYNYYDDIPTSEPFDETSTQLRSLKLKALRAQQLLDERSEK